MESQRGCLHLRGGTEGGVSKGEEGGAAKDVGEVSEFSCQQIGGSESFKKEGDGCKMSMSCKGRGLSLLTGGHCLPFRNTGTPSHA